MEGYKIGTETLKTYLSIKELSIDNVNMTMDELNDVLADQEELDKAMCFDVAVEEDDEIAEELDKIIQGELTRDKEIKKEDIAREVALISQLEDMTIAHSEFSIESHTRNAEMTALTD
jgi:hypothetical protein